MAFILLLLYKIVSPEQKKTIDFVSEYGNFNISIPNKLTYQIVPFRDITDNNEQYPDGGIKVFINENNSFYIYVSVSRSNIIGIKTEHLTTKNNYKVNVYSSSKQKNVMMVITRNDINKTVYTFINEKTYIQYKKIVQDVIFTININ